MNNTVAVARRMGPVGALAICAFSFAASTDPAPSFERIDLALGTPEDHIVLPGRFRGGALDDLAVVTVNEENQRELSVHSIVGEPGQRTWHLAHRQPLDEDVIFMDVVPCGRHRGVARGPTRADFLAGCDFWQRAPIPRLAFHLQRCATR